MPLTRCTRLNVAPLSTAKEKHVNQGRAKQDTRMQMYHNLIKCFYGVISIAVRETVWIQVRMIVNVEVVIFLASTETMACFIDEII